MKRRSIDFSRDEYITLLEMLEMATWVLFAHELHKSADRAKYEALEQKIYSFARTFRCEHLVVYDDELEKYFTTREFEEKSPATSFIDEFEDDTFWDELIHRLALRDAARKVGEEDLRELGIVERLNEIQPFEEGYQEEFSEHGLDRVEIRGE